MKLRKSRNRFRKKRVRAKGNDNILEKVAKRVKRSLNIHSPKVIKPYRDLVKANAGGEASLVTVPPNSKRMNSVQMNTFIDRKLDTEAFLRSLEEKG